MDERTKSVFIRVANLSAVGITLAVAIFGCLFIGVFLDAKLGTRPYLTIIMLLLGIAAGFRNLFYLAKRYGTFPSSLKDNPGADPRNKT